MKQLHEENIIQKGMGSEHAVTIFLNAQSPDWWWWSYWSRTKKKRVNQTLNIFVGSEEEGNKEDQKAFARKKAKTLYLQIEAGCVNMIEYFSNLIYDTRHIGTFRVMNPDFHEWMKIQQYDAGGYVYQIFPSNKDIHDQSVCLDTLISGTGSFVKENIVRGKIGCSGTGKDPQESLRSRMGTYIREIKKPGSEKDHKWMTTLHQNEDWYVAIFHVADGDDPESATRRISNTLAVEKAVITTVSRFLGMVPHGNKEESTRRMRSPGRKVAGKLQQQATANEEQCNE